MLKTVVVITVALLFVLSFGGFLGGFALLADPSGAMVGFPPEIIERLPVSNFMLPAVVLVVVFGLAPAYTLLKLTRVLSSGVSLVTSYYAVMCIASALIVWLGFQIRLLGWGHYLQTLMVIVAVLLLLCGIALLLCSRHKKQANREVYKS